MIAIWVGAGGFLRADSPWNLQAVDVKGEATHPKVGTEVTADNRVVVEGIALNATGDYLNPAQMWQTYVQVDSPDQGGIAAFAAIFYDNSQWPRYPMDILPGDRVRIEGYTEFHNGKTNLNERHSASPDLRMKITKLASGVGLPAPQVVFQLNTCSGFDAARTTGGEYFQNQWVELEKVKIQSGEWVAGQNVIVEDDAGSTLTLLLSARGTFTSPPAGSFNIRGIFDQEDSTSPFTGDYRLWVRNQEAVIAYPGGDGLWGLQAVDATGNAIHPKVGASVESVNKVVIEGIALNSPDEILNTDMMWQVYVQAEGPDWGGIAVFAAIFYDNSQWPRYPMDFQAGDRVRVEGYTEFHNGKTNLNERHSASPDLRFTVTRLATGVGLPAPRVIPSIASCNYFDPRGLGGGQRYQAQWTQLHNVHVVSGTWAAGETVTISDDSGQSLDMLLSEKGDFDASSVPKGEFSVRGIFDQEDSSAPCTGGYRIWVKHSSDVFQPKPPASSWLIY